MSEPPSSEPVAALEPPYYSVVFTSVLRGQDDEYDATSERMEELVAEVPGYLGMDSARSAGGLGITVAYFRDEGAITRWRDNLEHRAAQQRGRDDWYERYTLHIGKVERSYAFVRNG